MMEKTSGNLDHIQCEDCGALYVGETERSLKTRFQEHCRWSSMASEVLQNVNKDRPDHDVSLDSINILTAKNKTFETGVKETVYIQVAQLSINRDDGQYLLPAVWTNMRRARVHEPLRSQDYC